MTKEFTGCLEALYQVEIRQRIASALLIVYVKDGAPVTTSALLFSVAPRPYAAELLRGVAPLATAWTQSRLAEKEPAHALQLLLEQARSQQEADQPTATADSQVVSAGQAPAALHDAGLKLEYTAPLHSLPFTDLAKWLEGTPVEPLSRRPAAGRCAMAERYQQLTFSGLRDLSNPSDLSARGLDAKGARQCSLGAGASWNLSVAMDEVGNVASVLTNAADGALRQIQKTIVCKAEGESSVTARRSFTSRWMQSVNASEARGSLLRTPNRHTPRIGLPTVERFSCRQLPLELKRKTYANA